MLEIMRCAPCISMEAVYLAQGSLEVKLRSNSMDRCSNRAERNQGRERESQKRKGRQVAKHSVFPILCGFGGSKSSLIQAAGAKPSGQMRDQ